MKPEFLDSALGSPVPLARALTADIEAAVLQLVVDGFERWRDGGFKRYGDYEDDFTIRLYECMKEIRRERNMALIPIYQYVEPSDGMLAGDENPARSPRIDMVVSWDSFIEDAYLSIECKRLAPGDLPRRYVVCGIDRFVRGYYGAKAQIGAMVGYVIRGTTCEAFTRVNEQVERANGMGSEHTLIPSDPIAWLDTVFSSNHRRSSPFPTIRLTHLFFDMNGI